MKHLLIIVLLILISSKLCCQELNPDFTKGSFRGAGIDSVFVTKLVDHISEEVPFINSFLILRNDSLIVEAYFNELTDQSTQDIRSVTKSVIAILTGIAVDKGLIQSVDDPITHYLDFTEKQLSAHPEKKEITIRHILTMSSGLDCNDWDEKSAGQEDFVYKRKDWIGHTKDLPVIHDPGEVAAYCTMGAILTARILEKVSGRSLNEFADEFLFRPMGIKNVSWIHTSRKKDIISAGKRLQLTPRQMIAVGSLLLNDGKSYGRQIVSKKWIDDMLSAHSNITNLNYGYFWWQLPYLYKCKNLIANTATGNGGQYILVFRELDMVVVFTGNAYNSHNDKWALSVIGKGILPE